jgi:putative protease
MSIELLAPAGNSEALAAAVGEGADAVYLGLKTFNARLRSGNFAYSQFEGAVRALHKLNKKVYVTVNTVFIERETDRVYQLIKYLSQTGADAIIAQDFGVVRMVKEHFPALKLHSSTQMNVASSRACNVLSKNNVSRVVLARELRRTEIKKIRESTNVELEIFTHGALCVSASGLCLFSSFLGGKSANRGMCTQACRRLYSVDDEERGFYFSPLDLQLLEKLPSLAALGINSIKIEGRMKSAEYVGAVVRAYRKVIDALDESGTLENLDNPKAWDDKLKEAVGDAQKILQNDFAREKTIFHFEENTPEHYLQPEQDGGAGIKLGLIKKIKGSDDEKFALIEDSGVTPRPGDSIRLHKADDSLRVTHKITSVHGEGSDKKFWIDVPCEFDLGDSVYLIQIKSASHRYAFVMPKDLSQFRRRPGMDSAPPPKSEIKKAFFPEGLYAGVGNVSDLYIAQSVKVKSVILSLNAKTANQILNSNNPLPFKSDAVILNFDPFYNEEKDGALSEYVIKLIEAGYKNYIVNNLAHIQLLSPLRTAVNMIAGPYLYSFNRYAADFIFNLGVRSLITPFENSRQNLEKTFSPKERGAVFVTVFNYPPLFRIQSDLSAFYRFKKIKDSREEEFNLVNGLDASIVLPETPFSITDKIPFLQEAGFKRFIIDFSPLPLRKKFYKNIMDAANNALVLPGASRFNWKNGFFNIDEKASNK